MAQFTQAKPKTRQEKEALLKAARRAEQANILAGTRPLLEKDEQLLAFARARIAGGWKSKLNVGPEAFFAPFVNVALTERRFLVQHVHHTTGRPSEMLPHAYTFDKIARVTFTDIETYGGELACRLILHLENGLYVRLRLRGQLNAAGAKNMAELFDSLTTARRKTPISPTHSLCPQCDHVLEQPYKFCPFCGTLQPSRASNVQADEETPTLDHTGITIATPDEAPLAEGTAGVLPTPSRNGELAEGGIDQSFAPEMTISRETDFAYERDDLPAEFGFALPTPAVEREPVLEETETQSRAQDTAETGITLDASGAADAAMENTRVGGALDILGLDTAQDDANFNALADDGLFLPTDKAAPLPGEAEQGTGNMSASGRPEQETEGTSAALPDSASYDDMFAPDEPVQAQDGIQPGGVAFEQYDAQAFGELPFSDTPDENAFGAPSAGVDVLDTDGDVVRDDTTEPFTGPSEEAVTGTTAAGAAPADTNATGAAPADTNATGAAPDNAAPADVTVTDTTSVTDSASNGSMDDTNNNPEHRPELREERA